jgi:hypothetical protein
MRSVRRLCALALIALLAGTIPVSAQVTTGSVAGTVKDAQGGLIPGATVVLISEARGTRSAPAMTGPTGDFVFPNVTVDTYTIEITMPSFRTLRRTGVAVSAGSRVAAGTLVIEVGGATETVEVKAEAPVIQAASGERSFTIPTESVQNLPLSNRSFHALANLAPGVSGTQSIGTRAEMSTNITMDGISTLDTGSNSVMLQMNTESVAEVKLLVSGYQAEYGRNSGLQILAVTKSGTNQFRGSVYDVERNTSWNANSKTNKLNGTPKTIRQEKDWGYSIGGPIGRPGGNNKLFFFNALEFRPRTGGNDQQTFRVPTALERRGDFSQTTDNLGAPYPYIRDPLKTGACNATSQAACFADGGVVGRIPADRLYQPGLAILNMWPLPTSSTTIGTNFQYIRPVENTLSYQPAIRFDYQARPSLRVSYKYQGNLNRPQVTQGTIPGWNDGRTTFSGTGTDAASVNYNLSPTMFLEATLGRAWNAQQNNLFLINDVADSRKSGLAALPLLYPDAAVIPTNSYNYKVLNTMDPPYWDGTRVWNAPEFQWGNRIVGPNNVGAPPNLPYSPPRRNRTWDLSASLTKVAGRHTIKAGYWFNNSLKQEIIAATVGNSFGNLSFANDTANAFDTSFGFANAAIGSFTSFSQNSRYTEGNFIYSNHEAYVQDNWKVTSKLTLDYGVRFVSQRPLYDSQLQGGNFLPDRYSRAAAPVLYVAGCANGVYPCTGTNRQAMNPLTGQFLGPNTLVNVGSIVPGTGTDYNGQGLFYPGEGIVKQSYSMPAIAAGPRFGMAYDVTGKQRFVVRGGAGVYFDRARQAQQILAGNRAQFITVRYAQLQNFGTGGLATQGVPTIGGFEYDAPLPGAVAWNAGMQTMLPWATSLDVAYTGHHNYNAQLGGQTIPFNLNTIDLGTAFNPALQDRSIAPTGVPGATSLAAQNPNLVRGYLGYGTIDWRQYSEGWRTFHSMELSVNRRFMNGFQFGFSDTWVLSDVGSVPPRYDHGPDGQVVLRADQAEAQKLLGDQQTPTHNFKATFVWQLPRLPSSDSKALKAINLVLNDWQLSGIWLGTSGSAYTVTHSYQTGNANVNLTGSPDFAPRIRIVGDPGSGCSSDPYRQFNTAAFQGPLVGSVGLESGNGYLFGCFQSVLDLSIARNIRLGGSRTLQLRVDVFNAPNAAGITGRNTQLQLSSPADPVTPLNLPFDANGNVLPNRVRPNQAGFGAVSGNNAYQAPRMIQGYVRFGF